MTAESVGPLAPKPPKASMSYVLSIKVRNLDLLARLLKLLISWSSRISFTLAAAPLHCLSR